MININKIIAQRCTFPQSFFIFKLSRSDSSIYNLSFKIYNYLNPQSLTGFERNRAIFIHLVQHRTKKFFLFLILCLCFISGYAKEISSADRNTQAIVDYYTSLNKGFPSFKVVSRSLLVKNAYLDSYGHRVNLVKNTKKTLSAFPKHHTEILNIIAEGNEVFVRTETHAVQKGSLLGIEPTDKPITIIASNVFHFNDQHKIVFTTQIWNEMNVMKQLGYIVL